MNATWRHLTKEETRAVDAMTAVRRIGRLIEDADEVCTCGQYSREGEIGCDVPHDTFSEDLSAAIEHYIECASEVFPNRTRGESLITAMESLKNVARDINWSEKISPHLEHEIDQYMQSQLSAAA